MGTVQRTQDRGRQNAKHALRQLASEVRHARLAAGVSQRRVATLAGLSQPVVSRIEQAEPGAPVETIARLCAALGLRLSLRVYPDGSAVRDAGQLRLLERLRRQIHEDWRWASEVLVGTYGDLRAWDVRLSGPGTIGIDAETRLHDLQALQRRIEAKARDSGVDQVILLVAETRHNGRVLREHREALRSTFSLDTKPIMAALRGGIMPADSGIVVL